MRTVIVMGKSDYVFKSKNGTTTCSVIFYAKK